jgi:hypothetical protein
MVGVVIAMGLQPFPLRLLPYRLQDPRNSGRPERREFHAGRRQEPIARPLDPAMAHGRRAAAGAAAAPSVGASATEGRGDKVFTSARERLWWPWVYRGRGASIPDIVHADFDIIDRGWICGSDFII